MKKIIIIVLSVLVIAFIVYQGYKANEIAKEKVRQEVEIARQAEIQVQNIKKKQKDFEDRIYYDLLQIKNRMDPVAYMLKNNEYKELVQPFIDKAATVYNLNGSQVLKIKYNDLYVGMPASLLFLSWGLPSSENRTTTQSGERIQYVYRTSFLSGGKNNYAYTENGILISWQE
jgi:hypothetical protein